MRLHKHTRLCMQVENDTYLCEDSRDASRLYPHSQGHANVELLVEKHGSRHCHHEEGARIDVALPLRFILLVAHIPDENAAQDRHKGIHPPLSHKWIAEAVIASNRLLNPLFVECRDKSLKKTDLKKPSLIEMAH